MTDLDKLIEAVESGEFDHYIGSAQDAGFSFRQSFWVDNAYHGSLDAAKALHEALLPGYDYSIDKENGGYSVHIWTFLEAVSMGASDQSDARAWLLAILNAYRAQAS